MRDELQRRRWYRSSRRQSGDFTREYRMSSSNLAARLEHAATDALSQPSPEVRDAANDVRMVKSARRRSSFTNRKFVVHDQGLRLFRIR